MCLTHLIYTVRPCLIHTCHAMLRPYLSSQGHSIARPSLDGRAVTLRRTAWSEHGKCESDTAALCKSNGKDILYSKPLAAGHGRGTAWAWHAMCESAFIFNTLSSKVRPASVCPQKKKKKLSWLGSHMCTASVTRWSPVQ